MTEAKIYGVSHGNGYDGVSRLYPNYYVQTSDPWRLARLACVAAFTPVAQDFVLKNMIIDGEEDFVIAALVYEGPNGETAFDACWHITEVFLVKDTEDCRDSLICYDSIDAAFDNATLDLVSAKM